MIYLCISRDGKTRPVNHNGLTQRSAPTGSDTVGTPPRQGPLSVGDGFSRPDNNWLQIEKMLNAKIIPSSERIKEYLTSSSLRENYGNNLQKVLCCIAAILRLEEERPDFVNPEVKKIISSLESGDSLRQGKKL